MNICTRAIIDNINDGFIEGHIDAQLSTASFFLYNEGKRIPCQPVFKKRSDLPPKRTGFRIQNALIKADLIITHHIFFSVNEASGETRLPYWKFAYLRQMIRHHSDCIAACLQKKEFSFEYPEESNNIYNNVILGQKGYLFLKEGTNALLAQYSEREEACRAQMDKVLVFFTDRKKFCDEHGIVFLQILIPEKTSVLHELTGHNLPDMTTRYRYLTSKTRLLPYVVDVYEDFRRQADKTSLYLQGDTHFSSQAALCSMQAILKALDFPYQLSFDTLSELYVGCDLLFKIMKGRKYRLKKLSALTLKCNGKAIGTPHLDENITMEGHIGTLCRFSNPTAPIKKKVLCFGNSFFERGGSSSGLTWHCARLFSEFLFIWEPSMLKDTILKEKPDIVLCQTIERFLANINMIRS